MKELSVIILNWNGLEIMKEFLPSVVENTFGEEVELIVVDNGSDDGSQEWLKREFPGLKVMFFDNNHGFAEGYNLAIQEVNTPYVLLLNSDVAVGKNWWQPLLNFMKTHPEAGAAQPKILSYKNPDQFEYAGAAGGLMDALGYPYCRGRVLGNLETDKGQYDASNEEIAWASGAAMIVSRDKFLKAGGFDSKFFAHMEEIDLCCRMWLKGWSVNIVPSSKVRHLGGGSLNYGNPRKTYLNFRNNLLLLYKNLPEEKGKSFLFKRRLADTLAFLMFLVKTRWQDAGAVVKAHRDFRKMKKEYTRFPEVDIMKILPGTEKYIMFSFFSSLKKRKKEKSE